MTRIPASTSASTVGLPRESMISRATTSTMELSRFPHFLVPPGSAARIHAATTDIAPPEEARLPSERSLPRP